MRQELGGPHSEEEGNFWVCEFVERKGTEYLGVRLGETKGIGGRLRDSRSRVELDQDGISREAWINDSIHGLGGPWQGGLAGPFFTEEETADPRGEMTHLSVHSRSWLLFLECIFLDSTSPPPIGLLFSKDAGVNVC